MAHANNLTLPGDSCTVSSECSGGSVYCDYGTCQCSWRQAMTGGDCESLTADSAWAMVQRAAAAV